MPAVLIAVYLPHALELAFSQRYLARIVGRKRCQAHSLIGIDVSFGDLFYTKLNAPPRGKHRNNSFPLRFDTMINCVKLVLCTYKPKNCSTTT